MQLDWQTLITLAMGAVALLYLARRWWPAAFKSPVALAHHAHHTHQAASGQACGPQRTTDGACGGGSCGACGQAGPSPMRDHRVHITRHKQP